MPFRGFFNSNIRHIKCLSVQLIGLKDQCGGKEASVLVWQATLLGSVSQQTAAGATRDVILNLDTALEVEPYSFQWKLLSDALNPNKLDPQGMKVLWSSILWSPKSMCTRDFRQTSQLTKTEIKWFILVALMRVSEFNRTKWFKLWQRNKSFWGACAAHRNVSTILQTLLSQCKLGVKSLVVCHYKNQLQSRALTRNPLKPRGRAGLICFIWFLFNLVFEYFVFDSCFLVSAYFLSFCHFLKISAAWSLHWAKCLPFSHWHMPRVAIYINIKWKKKTS